MDDDRDDEILDFASRWCLYGGGPAEEIAARFGVDEVDFFRRVQSLMARRPSGMSGHVADQIRRVSRHRLWLAA